MTTCELSIRGCSSGGSDADVEMLPPPSLTTRNLAWELFGLDANELDVWLKRLISAAEPVLGRFERIAAKCIEFVEILAAQPPVAGYEDYLQSKLDYHELQARLLCYFLLGFGKAFQAETNDGRLVSTLVREIASSRPRSKAAISKRAQQLAGLCGQGRGGHAALCEVVSTAAFAQVLPEFEAALSAACERDGVACARLRELCEFLYPHLPDPRGRKLSISSATHVVVAYWMEASGKSARYTYKDGDQEEGLEFRYCDSLTRATRIAFGDDSFHPLHAIGILKRKLAQLA